MSALVQLILGGTRSGKSGRAEYLAGLHAGPVVYLATYAFDGADSQDEEMRRRIESHRARRPESWTTVENRFDLAGVLGSHPDSLILMDCLTLWLSYQQITRSEVDILSELDDTLAALPRSHPGLIMVSSELGMGLVPSTPEGRQFRDLAGRANQLVASRADRVEFVVAGLPWTLKGPSK